MAQETWVSPEAWAADLTGRIVKRFGPECRCCHLRAGRWPELIKYLWTGGAFDINAERRCIHTAGHSEAGYPHQTRDGTRWWKD